MFINRSGCVHGMLRLSKGPMRAGRYVVWQGVASAAQLAKSSLHIEQNTEKIQKKARLLKFAHELRRSSRCKLLIPSPSSQSSSFQSYGA